MRRRALAGSRRPIAALGLGVAALLFWLAWRATYISNRYYEPIDLALIVAAAVGIGWLAPGVAARTRSREHRRAGRRGSRAVAVVAGIAA